MEKDLYKNKYQTDSIRLKDWDYCRNGVHFVAICIKNRQHFWVKSAMEL
ncbi:MAG TPA: hypothetical protein VFG39_05565 [Balneolaceae bacterium]|nr:hypothetical protein [Balneolaceae bacterium]